MRTTRMLVPWVVDGRTRLRVQADQAARDAIGDAEHGERDERDQRRPVHDSQQHEHQGDCHEQQLVVDRREDLLEVGVEAERAGHVDARAPRARGHDAAQLLAPVRQPVVVVRQRQHGVGDVAARGDQA
jgi:hypothetical protein